MKIVDIDDEKGIVHIELGEPLGLEGEARLREAADQMQRTFHDVVVLGTKVRLHAKPKPNGFSKPLLRRQGNKFEDRVDAIVKMMSDDEIAACQKRSTLKEAVGEPSFVGTAGSGREPEVERY